MVQFKLNLEVEYEDGLIFTFRRGYSYQYSKVKHGIEVRSIDGRVKVKLDDEGMKKYLEG